jgi:hypothetical protein
LSLTTSFASTEPGLVPEFAMHDNKLWQDILKSLDEAIVHWWPLKPASNGPKDSTH